jgi:NADPH:quinone reductase-like Zn-dependent oxidoreductase
VKHHADHRSTSLDFKPLKNKWCEENQMNNSSNLLVLGATGQVGKLVAKTLKRRGASFSVGSRKRANLEELAA